MWYVCLVRQVPAGNSPCSQLDMDIHGYQSSYLILRDRYAPRTLWPRNYTWSKKGGRNYTLANKGGRNYTFLGKNRVEIQHFSKKLKYFLQNDQIGSKIGVEIQHLLKKNGVEIRHGLKKGGSKLYILLLKQGVETRNELKKEKGGSKRRSIPITLHIVNNQASGMDHPWLTEPVIEWLIPHPPWITWASDWMDHPLTTWASDWMGPHIFVLLFYFLSLSWQRSLGGVERFAVTIKYVAINQNIFI